MKNIKLEFHVILFLGLLLVSQISFAQDLVVRPNDATSNHTMMEPKNTFFGAFYGYQAGRFNTGCCNTFIGSTTGGLNTTGIENTFLGTGAGEQSTIGNGNTYLGRFAGRLSTGSRNVFLGRYAGYFEQGNDLLYIDNSVTSQPLLHGFFTKDSLVINGDLNVTGDLVGHTIDQSQITSAQGNGYSAWLPAVLDNTTKLEITGVFSPSAQVLITKPVGFEIDTFTLGGTCLNTHVGYSHELPFTFETDNASDIAELNNWYANPNATSMSIITYDLAGNEKSRINLFQYYPGTTSVGSDGRTSFTLFNGQIAQNSISLDIEEYYSGVAVEFETPAFGSLFSFDPATDKIVDINGITHANFTPSVQVDYANRIVTLEITYNEGAGLIDWIEDVSDGLSGQKKTMSISETSDGTTVTSIEDFFEVLPFKYEIIYGLGLHSKMVARIQLIYGCNAPG